MMINIISHTVGFIVAMFLFLFGFSIAPKVHVMYYVSFFLMLIGTLMFINLIF